MCLKTIYFLFHYLILYFLFVFSMSSGLMSCVRENSPPLELDLSGAGPLSLPEGNSRTHGYQGPTTSTPIPCPLAVAEGATGDGNECSTNAGESQLVICQSITVRIDLCKISYVCTCIHTCIAYRQNYVCKNEFATFPATTTIDTMRCNCLYPTQPRSSHELVDSLLLLV